MTDRAPRYYDDACGLTIVLGEPGGLRLTLLVRGTLVGDDVSTRVARSRSR